MKKIIATFASLLLCFPAYSVSQGTLDPTSVGSFNITVTIPERVQISGLEDFAFGQYPGNGNVEDDDDICVYSNSPTAGYRVTATGSGTSNAFTLTDGDSNTIPYTPFWNDEIGTTDAIQLFPNAITQTQTGANNQSYTCVTGGDSANVRVFINSADISGKPNGNYTGTLTLDIQPI